MSKWIMTDEEMSKHLNELRIKNYIRKILQNGLKSFVGQENTEENRKKIIDAVKARMKHIMDVVDVPEEYRITGFSHDGTRVIVSFGLKPGIEVKYGKEIDTGPKDQADESSGKDYS